MDLTVSYCSRRTKNMKMYFIVGIVILTFSQVSVSSASEMNHSMENSLQKSLSSPGEGLNSSLISSNSAVILQQIVALNDQISNFTELRTLEMSDKGNLELNNECNNKTALNPESYGSFIPPDLQAKIDKIRNKLNSMAEVIVELRNASIANENITQQIDILEESVIKLEDLINKAIVEMQCQLEELRSFVKALDEELAKFEKELGKIKEQVEHSTDPETQTRLRQEIIREIRDRQYASALKKLRELDGNQTVNINYIIHEVYNSRDENFDVVLGLGDRSDIPIVSLAVYRALNYEMTIAEHKNHFQLLMLIDGLQRNVVDKSSASADEVAEAKSLKSKVRDLARGEMIPLLKEYLSNDKYDEAKFMFEKIYNHEPSLYLNVLKPALQGRDTSEFYKLMELFETHSRKVQSVFGISAAYFELKGRYHNVYPNVFVRVGVALRRVYPLCYGCPEGVEARRMKNDMPSSLRSLSLASRVCLFNIRNREYMYAANDYFKFDRYRRRVFSWVPGERVNQGYWVIEPKEETFYIKNTAHNEYLYAAGFKKSEQRRFVFTWARGGVDSDQFKWSFEISGNQITIRNVEYDNFLLADDQSKFDSDRRYVFTWTEKRTTVDSFWTAEDC